MAARLVPRSQRVAGVEIAPGRRTVVALGRQVGDAEGEGVGAWVAVGRTAGPRVSVLGAACGFELAAALAARALTREIDLGSLQGSLVVAPVFRPGDRFARPGRRAVSVRLPGDSGGGRKARLAFGLYSDVIVNADQVIVLAAPRPGRRGLLVAEAAMDDPRARRLALACGAQAVLPAVPAAGSLLAVAAAAGRAAVRLSVGGSPGGLAGDAAVLLAAVRRALAGVGSHPFATPAEAATPARLCLARALVHAPCGGMLEEAVEEGALVAAGDVLGRVGPVIAGETQPVLAPIDGLVIEAPATPAVRRGAVLFVIGQTAPGDIRRGARPAPRRLSIDAGTKLHAGWLERVSLPDLGIGGVPAKIDTGARTSALHVISSRVVGHAAGPSRRPILELTLPAGGGSRRRLVVRAPVKEYIEVRDTSGRLERRPVIETTLALGPLRRRIRITLTDRGDMQCPMLVGRTALAGGVVVDPSARYVLGTRPGLDARSDPARVRGPRKKPGPAPAK
jgi:predicted deacylase